MTNIIFLLVDLTVNRVNPSLSGTSLIAVDRPLKYPVIYHFTQNTQNLHVSCLTIGNNSETQGMSPVRL